MTDDGWREGALNRLSALEAGQKGLSERIFTIEKNNAVAEAHHNNVEKRLTGIEGTLTKLVWLIISSLVLAIMGYALQGGFSIG